MNRLTKGIIYSIGLVVVGTLCFYGGRIVGAGLVPVQERITARVIPTVSIYDEGELIEFSIEDMGKYHGDVCPCVAVAFKATQLAISKLWGDEIPERNDFKIISKCPTQGCQDVIEFITRAKTRGDFRIELPEGTDYVNMTRDNFSFIFVRKSTGDSIEISVKKGQFPKGFFELRKKTKFGEDASLETREAFELAKEKVKQTFLNSRLDKLFIYEKK